jgi:hypothetical protein
LTHFQSLAFAGNLEFFGPTGVSIAFAGKLRIVIQSAAKDPLLACVANKSRVPQVRAVLWR